MGEGDTVWLQGQTDFLGVGSNSNSVWCQEPADEVVTYPALPGRYYTSRSYGCLR
ncbi:hypothetical protein [Streptomyces fulvoviolaceus]|uniref:hypothetical protein n=1 Tax=Streptomyces fulvoviolaceus TaxID=285535 RepID=UPI00131B112B|nr:hypothetical protein [Streptomyces fulvoviolaceus]MCT9076950.1 hypothetical protein [Streptomyces fulvoviolaceus]